MRSVTFWSSIVIFLSATNAMASCYTKFDYSSGNSYTVCQNQNNTTIRGYNSQTGSMWSQNQNSNGTYSGTDSNGNYYTGNNKTGSYTNFGTGKTCFGTGALRTCY